MPDVFDQADLRSGSGSNEFSDFRLRWVKMLSDEQRIPVQNISAWQRRIIRVDTQEVIVELARMDVNVQMRNFLECRLADGTPETKALAWKGAANGASDP